MNILTKPCARLATALVMLASAVAPVARAGAAPLPPPPDGAKLFSVNCVVCHGEDGKGTETGKALKTPDLHGPTVQKETDAVLIQTISGGKNNMPPFMSTLSKADIQALVVYIRSFAKKK